ncbi:MAG: carboxymuconolactone decarboxylase family protein, partial [Janthinobacterium lividum]
MADVNTTQGATRLELGRQTFERVMGAPAQGFLDTVGGMAPGYGERILEWEFADAYNRSGLDLKTRELVIVAACAAIGATGHDA